MAYQDHDALPVWEDEWPQGNWDTVPTPTGGSSEEFSAMGATLTEQYYVKEEGLRIVNFC